MPARWRRPRRDLAITFTRKAAGEILASLVQRLTAAAGDEAHRAVLGQAQGTEELTAADCHALIDRLVGALHRLSVGTIDSFFQRLARAFRWEQDLPVDPLMADDRRPEAVALRQEAIAAVLADPTGGDLGRLFLRFHRARPARPVAQAFDALIGGLHEVWRLAPERRLWEGLEVPRRLEPEDLTRAVAALADMEAHLPTTRAGGPNKTWEKAWRAALDAARQGDWRAVLANGLVSRVATDQEIYARHQITPPWPQTLAPLVLHAVAGVLGPLLEEHLAAFELLSGYEATYQRLRRGRRLLRFCDLTWQLARHLPELLRHGLPRVQHRLDTGIDHLLLDEFQDTSPLQWQVLEAFADDVARRAPGGASLFVVGDVKQAIYGWRGGDAALFDTVEGRYGLEVRTWPPATARRRPSWIW